MKKKSIRIFTFKI